MSILKKLFLIFIALMIITPVIPVIILSFSGNIFYPNIFPEQFTLDNYKQLFDTYNMGKVILNSFKLSIIVMLVALVLGIAPAKYIGTHNFRGKTLAQVIAMMPFMAPSLVILFGLLPIYAKMGIYLTFLSLVITECIFVVPYMIMVLVPIFRNYDSGIEDQAATLGIGSLSRLLSIVFPTIKSGLVVSCMYAFMSSWSMFLAVSMYSPRGFNTIATLLYPAITSGLNSEGLTAAIAILYFIPSVIFLIISTWVMGSDNVNNQRV